MPARGFRRSEARCKRTPKVTVTAWVRDLVGHGVGYDVHEEPRVPNYVDADTPDIILKKGMVIAIEPMINAGTWQVKTLPDGWTVKLPTAPLRPF